MKSAMNRASERLRQRRLSYPGHIFDQQMSTGEKTDQRHPHRFGFAANAEFDGIFDLPELSRRDTRGQRCRK
jgi:hypothetical protein